MTSKFPKTTPRHCLQHSRFTKQAGWIIWHLSVGLSGSIAVSGGNEYTDRTLIDVYSFKTSDSRDKPKLYYSKEFEKYEDEEWTYRRRLVAFTKSDQGAARSDDDDNIVTCIGNELEVIRLSSDEVLLSRKINGSAYSLSVRNMELFVSFYQSQEITEYDLTDLNEVRSITLHELPDSDVIPDMTAVTESIYARTYNIDTKVQRALEFQEGDGNGFRELTSPGHPVSYVWSVAVSVQLGVVAVVSSDSVTVGKGVDQIVFYSATSNCKSSFLTVQVESDLYRIRISDKRNGILTGIQVTGQVNIYRMADLYSYRSLKGKLASTLSKKDCVRLSEFFALPEEQTALIMKSDTPAENLLLALEGKGVLLPSNVLGMKDALQKLEINSFCYHIVDIFQRTRTGSTSYDKFLSTLSTHLTASVPDELCGIFSVPGEKKSMITSSQNPGFSLLMTLDSKEVIDSSEVRALEQAFTELRLEQAVAKVSEYQATGEEQKILSHAHVHLTLKQKEDLFIQCLKDKIKTCYEALSPIPWKNSCRWKATDLFVETSLILTDSKSRRGRVTSNKQLELHYREIFRHEQIKAETRIVIEGDPGSGKTMLMHQLAYDWFQGKLKDVKIFILLPMKQVKGPTFVQAIKDFYVPDDDRLSVNDIELLLSSENNSRCFLLDDWEEHSVVTKEGELSEVMEVITKVRFPNCKAVISSRPHLTKTLPQYSVLRLGKFQNEERSAYIQKVFPDNVAKQTDAKAVTIDNNLINAICSLPLLFVMVVHNLHKTKNPEFAKTDKVTPLVKSVVEALCDADDANSKPVEPRGMSLEQLAYEGLCEGKQQLHWQKEFIEAKLGDSKRWIDSGILVMEEIIADMKHSGTNPTPDLLGNDTTIKDALDLKGKENIKKSSARQEAVAELQAHLNSKVKSLNERDNSKDQLETNEGLTTSCLPLQVKFFHPIIQEWFAAMHLSSVIPTFRNSFFLQRHLEQNLLRVDPFGLRYVLRFAVALSPACCHIVMKDLLDSYRTESGDVPKHVMDYMFLCFAEYDGRKLDVIDAVAEVCKEDILINSKENRTVQRAKVDMLQLASNCGVVLGKLHLADVVVSATENAIQFGSGVNLGVLHTVERMEVYNSNTRLTIESCRRILKFIAKWTWIKEVCLNLPQQPPEVDPETEVRLRESGKTVTWIIGSQMSQALDTETNEWMHVDRTSELLTPSADCEEYFGEWDERTPLEVTVEDTESKRGGVINIPHTGVQLEIPPGALPEGMAECDICMKIIPSDFSDFSTTGYSSNSSVIVELLPNNLTFQRPCKLTLPHCLQLKKGTEYKATVFMSHHKEGTYPRWEEQTGLSCDLTDATCTIMLNRFSWVKYVIADEIVEAQRIQVYAAGKYVMPFQRAYEIEVGFFPDIPGGGERLRSNKTIDIISKRSLLVHKGGKEPLQLFLEKVIPEEWKIIHAGKRPKEIPYEAIDLFKERSSPFKFVNYSEEPLTPIFVFRVVQGDKAVCLRYRAKVRVDVSESTQTE